MTNYYPGNFFQQFSTHRRRLALFGLMAMALAIYGCGGGDDQDTAEQTTNLAASMQPASVTTQNADSLAALNVDATDLSASDATTEQSPTTMSAVTPESTTPSGGATAAATSSSAPEQKDQPATSTTRPQSVNTTVAEREYGPYCLQVGSFKNPNYAQQRVDKLQTAGVSAIIVDATFSDVVYHRVYVINLADMYEATRLGERLREELGFSYLIRKE